MENQEHAFPIALDDGWVQRGMTLRDYFAAASLNALLNDELALCVRDKKFVAETAYVIADEMLKAREKS